MLKRFELRNYKTFNGSLRIDFDDVCGYQFNTNCITDGLLGKMLIYGRNATGKTNLGGALQDIYYTLFLLRHRDMLINADTDSDELFFSYTFVFDKDELKYEYVRSKDDKLLFETLFLNGNLIYKVDVQNKRLLEEKLDQLEEGPILFDRYFESNNEEQIDSEDIPFLRWISSNVALANKTHLISLIDYVKRMQFIPVQNKDVIRREATYIRRFYPMLEDKEELAKFETYLNYMGVDCKLVLKTLPDGQFELYFKHKTLVPFYESASSGTRSLTELYQRVFIWEKEPTLLYLDEFDAFFHYEMAERILKYLIDKYPKTQVILTTHNTNLMSNRFLRPDCLFILSRDGRMTSLPHATRRELREGHNLEKMYISGEFNDYE